MIRPAHAVDIPGVYRVCFLTGDAGDDASARHRNPDLLGHDFVGPCLRAHPDLAQVVVDEAGVAGDGVATIDTRAFEAWCERHWWPAHLHVHLVDRARGRGLGRVLMERSGAVFLGRELG